MKTPANKFLPLSIVTALLFISIACSGFLAGRNANLHREAQTAQMEQLRDGLVTSVTLLQRGIEAVKLVILR